MRTRIPALLVAGVLSTGLIACGDDDDDEAAAPASTAASEEPAADVEAFCDAFVEGKAFLEAGPTPGEEEAFGEQAMDHITRVEAETPVVIAAEVATVIGAARKAVETGDQSDIGTPAFEEADAAIGSFLFDSCELSGTIETTAREYEFEGVSETVAAGRVGLRFRNEGKEIHELAVLRIEGDLTAEELLALPEEEQHPLFVHGQAALPGDESAALADLPAGRYVIACFVPVGTTSPEEDAGSDAPPHHTQGMWSELEVTA